MKPFLAYAAMQAICHDCSSFPRAVLFACGVVLSRRKKGNAYGVVHGVDQIQLVTPGNYGSPTPMCTLTNPPGSKHRLDLKLRQAATVAGH